MIPIIQVEYIALLNMGCFLLSTLHLISDWLLMLKLLSRYMLENWIYFAIWWVSSTQLTEKAAVGEF